MKMIPVPTSKLSCIDAIVKTCMSEMVCRKGVSFEAFKASVENGYLNEMVDVYVDDISKPNHIMVLSRYPSFWMIEGTVAVMLIYSMPEARNNPETITGFKTLLDNYTEIHEAESLVGASYTYRGTKGIDSLWRSWGFEKQETIYVKEL